MTTLRLALIKGGLYDDLYGHLDEFTRATGVDIEIPMHLAQDDLNHALLEEAKNPRLQLDLVTTHSKYSPSIAPMLLPLDDILDPDEVEAYLPSTIELCRIDGSLRQLPRNCDVRLMFYRPSQVGPDATELLQHGTHTWNDVLQIARDTQESGHHGYVFTGKLSGLVGSFYELLISAGGEFLDDADAPLFESAAGEWALGTLRDLYRTGDPGMDEWSYDEVANTFGNGNAAISCDWPGYWATIYQEQPQDRQDDMGVTVYPAGPAGSTHVYGGCHTFAVTSSSANRQAAIQLLRFLTSDELLAGEAARGSLVPKWSIMNSIHDSLAPGSIEHRRWASLSDTVERFLLPPPRTSRWPMIEDSLWPELRNGFTGRASVEQALEDCARVVRDASSVRARAQD